MKSINDSHCLEDLQRSASEGRSLHDDACHFYQEAMGRATMMREFPPSDDVVESIGLINDHATNDLRSSCVARDLREAVAPSLWSGSFTPSAKERFL